MSQGLEITVDRKNGFVVVRLAGKVSRDSLPALSARFEELIAGGADGIAVDFERVKYLDSAGMGCCVRLLKQMRENDCGILVIFGASHAVAKVWKLIRMDLVIPLLSSEEEALARLREGPVS